MPHIGAANRRGIVGPWGKSRQEDKAMSIATASDFEIAPARPLLRPLISATGCVVLADWLFYGWQIGISVAVFFSVLGIVVVASNGVHTTRNIQIVMSAAFIAGLLALIEDVNTLSMIVGALATAMFVIVITAEETSPWQRYLFEAATTPFRGPFRLGGDVFGALRHMKIWTPGWLGSLISWIVPLSVFAVFLALFSSSANPLIENRLMQVDLRAFFNLLDANRIWFWILVACTIWPLLRRRIRREPTPELEPRPTNAVESSDLDYLLGIQAVTRSLVLFNVLFALQTGLDLVYLWGGVALPDGLTYAEYAHRGAYPLIATALLAAGFALIAMRPGGPAEKSGLIRPLVLVWTGQNVLLVISSILRLDLYVAAYSLTYLRLAALVWMGLVAGGLLLMLIQIMLKKPNSWLVAANAATLALVLYGCCLINAPQVIASYNVEHCREVGGPGPNLDLKYLFSLGPQVLPILEPRLLHIPMLKPDVEQFRFGQDYEARRRLQNWRAWSFRAWRLERYLSNNPYTPSYLSKSDKG
jgi:Domain of unknown function (DUF4173)